MARLLIACLAALATCLASSAALAQLSSDPYAGMESLTYQAHQHPANVSQVACMADPDYDPAVQCCHSYHWCDEAFDQARQNGVEALLQAHHASHLMPSRAGFLDVWKSLGIGFQHAFGRRETYPTHPDGLPLAVSGGHTDDELASLWECAEAKNDPGEFLAFFGIEYTVHGALSAECVDSAGQARCGGHKTAVFATRPTMTCSGGEAAPPEHRCESEAELYAMVRAHGGLVNVAHPATFIASDFTRFDAVSAPGGIDASVVRGYEFGPNSEDHPCDRGVAGCGYWQALALGYRLHPTSGEDLHGQFGAEGAGCSRDRGLAGSGARASCWVESFTRAGLLDAMDRLRCAWIRSGDPSVKWTLAGTAMGGSIATSDLPEDPRIEIDVDWLGGAELHSWQIVHGDTAGGDGNAQIVLSGSCEPDRCLATLALPDPASPGWYYLRVEGPGALLAATAPVWLTESAPVPLEIVAGPQGSPNPAVSGGVVAIEVELAGPTAPQAGYQWTVTCPGLSWNGFLLGSTTPTPTWFVPGNAIGAAQVCSVEVLVNDGSGATTSASYAQSVLPEGAAADGDGDGLPDLLEAELGSDPGRADSDGDGDSDYVEVVAGSDPVDASDRLAPDLDERPDGSVQLSWPGRSGVRYELLWADGLAEASDGTGTADLPDFLPFASFQLASDGPAEYVDDGTGSGAPPQGAAARLYALRVEGPDPVSGSLVLVTGSPSGFVRVPLRSAGSALIGMPFIPANASLASVLGGQLSAAQEPQEADHVIGLDAQGRLWRAWLHDPGGLDPEFLGSNGQPVESEFSCGHALVVDHRGPAVDLFLSGRLASRASVDHLLAPGLRLFSPCYAADGMALEDSGLAVQGAIGATTWDRSDRVGTLDSETGRYEQYFLFDSSGADPARDGRWLPVQGPDNGPLRFQAGQGYTYIRVGAPALLWSETRPYELP